MTFPLNTLIEAIHASPIRCVLYIAGAGSSAISHLTSIAGCSQTLLDARVPYSIKSTFHMLDDQPIKIVSSDVARQLAQHAYHNALLYNNNNNNKNENEKLIGIGSSAAIQTNRIRHGKDCAFVAAWSKEEVKEYSIELPGNISRDAQEEQVKLLIFKALAEYANIPFEILLNLVSSTEISWKIPESPLKSVLEGETTCVVFNSHGELRTDIPPYVSEVFNTNNNTNNIEMKRLLFPGSFAPLHWGHTELVRAAIKTILKSSNKLKNENKIQVTYEIAVKNADKGTITSVSEIENRVKQFLNCGERVAVTTSRLFTEKASLFPNHGFIVGIDTVKRILDPKYYNNSKELMLNSLQEIKSKGGYFVVGGRLSSENDNLWEDLTCVKVPEEFQSMFISIEEKDFRVDVSSTALRKRDRVLA